MISRVIAVAGPKGSPGCSFVTAGLGLCLAAAGLATVIIDADAEERGLADSLGCERPEGRTHGPVEISRQLGLMEAPFATGPDVDGRQLVTAARTTFEAAVVDLGHQPGTLQVQIAMAADWLLWVVSTDPIGLGRADRLLAAPRLVTGSSGLLINRQSQTSLRGAEPALAERHRLPLMGILSERPSLTARPLLSRPPHRDRVLGRPFRELARTLHPRSSSVAPAWP